MTMTITPAEKEKAQALLTELKRIAANQFEWSAAFTTDRILDRLEVVPDAGVKLWFIKDQHPDFETDRDLLVYAATDHEATIFWREYYKTELEERPTSVKEVPAATTAGVVPWGKLT